VERRGVTEQGGMLGYSFRMEPASAGLPGQRKEDSLVSAMVEGRRGFNGKKSGYK